MLPTRQTFFRLLLHNKTLAHTVPKEESLRESQQHARYPRVFQWIERLL
jgi:hypothetical protein